MVAVPFWKMPTAVTTVCFTYPENTTTTDSSPETPGSSPDKDK